MNRLGLFLILLAVLVLENPAAARTRKGDKLLAQAHVAEAHGELDKALEFDEAALAEDPSDPAYMLATRRVRFNSAEKHIKAAQKMRNEGRLTDALAEFQHAYAIDPASPVAQQEIRRTKAMIDRENKKTAQPGQSDKPEDQAAARAMTPVEVARKAQNERIDSLEAVPDLRPLNSQPINLKMNNQKPRVLFETVGKVAGINVLFDPEYDTQNTIHNQSVDLTDTTLAAALDQLSLLTKSFWKPLSANAIFVTVDNTTKRREFEEQVVRVFYLNNIKLTTELQEIITALRTVADIQKIYQYTTQSALVVRAEADKMLLAEKIIADLDKPQSEVVVDVVVMEVRSDKVRNLATQIAPGGLNTTIGFNPTRAKILGGITTTTTTPTTTTPVTTTTTTPAAATGVIPLPNVKKISSGDFSISGIPGGLIEALMSDTGTRVLQSPQLRAVDNLKVTLHIGDKVPTASGSFGSGIGGVGVGVSPLVQTQFTYIETGVNMEMTSKVHDSQQVSLHVDIDISQVTGYRDVGGIQQPIISQRKVSQDLRTEDGEITLLGGLIQQQDSKVVSGLPGLASIPWLGRLFSSENVTKTSTELLITLIPHIVRAPDLTEANLRPVASGNVTNYKVIRTAPPAKPAAAVAPLPTIPLAPPATAPAPAPTAPAPAGSAAVAFVPAQVDTQLGAAVSVSLRADNVTDLNSMLAQLKFDPKVLRITNIMAGDLLQRTGAPLNPSKNILNDSGDATVSIARDPAGPGVSGAGALITIVFQAAGRGTTTVALQQLVLKNTPGQPVATNTPSLTVNVR